MGRVPPPFIGPAWGLDGEPELVAALGGKGYPRARHKQRTRPVIDDFGNAVMYQRRCPDCLRWLPLSFEYFAPRNDGLAQGMDGRCGRCCRINGDRRRARDPERARALARAAYQRKAAEDPEWARERNRRSHEASMRLRQKDPERFKRLRREAQKRRWARIKADPAKLALKNADQRIDARLRREREGFSLDDFRAQRVRNAMPDAMVGRRVPSRHLVAVIDRAAQGDDGQLRPLCGGMGIAERILWAWRTGERPRVEVSVADRVLTYLDLLWWDVWNQDTVRAPLIAARLYFPRAKTLKSGIRQTYWERGERHYGDAGPDHETLRAIEQVWEGDREEVAA